MKANEFVKKFGWEQSIEAVKMMPKSWDYCCLRIPDFKFQKNVSCIADCVDMDDLKRLVESHELVESYKGLHCAKNTLGLLQSSMEIGLYHGMDGVDAATEIPRLKQAIADVEACGKVGS